MTELPLPPPEENGPDLDLSRYTLKNRLEVAYHLRTLVQHGDAITVFANRGQDFLLSRLLSVEDDQLVFDCSADESANQKLLLSERNVFVAAPDGVKTQFSTPAARRIQFEGRPAFATALPDEAIKLQRREFFRIQTVAAPPVVCVIGDFPGGRQAFPLFDISLGGVALTVPPTGAGFEKGTCYQACRIDLGSFGTLDVTLEVRHHLRDTLRSGQERLRVGCAFVALPTAMENRLQRFVANLERERRALVR
ncbi:MULTISPECIES: flagellar brake protein [Gulbenkiania]|uniref:Flagellar brake protein YcgR n=1 Tax=Gulbenkiania indica TaxID=375574 RepID=A0A0K6GTS0_9NEIS|nr:MULTISPECIES: flagellar brake protein [Gulbenkiania]CUA81958.1 c-di-GMP-binding flagellar brake protein YcgR, contains PilZNR and PilZ domains [Gulbenkiania indica]